MNWELANHIHDHEGHDEFLKQARECRKSEMFIRNVCNNNGCQE